MHERLSCTQEQGFEIGSTSALCCAGTFLQQALCGASAESGPNEFIYSGSDHGEHAGDSDADQTAAEDSHGAGKDRKDGNDAEKHAGHDIVLCTFVHLE